MLLLIVPFVAAGCDPENPVSVRDPAIVNIITGNSMTINLSIPNGAIVTIVVQNAVGDDIRTVMEDKPLAPGYYAVSVDLSGLERGGRIYFVTTRVSGQTRSYMFKLQ